MSRAINILIIDDEPIVIRSCTKALGKCGYLIDSASSGEEGVTKSSEKKYDIIITDLKMPGIGGIEALRRIKERDPKQIVIVFTGHADVGTARESLKLGAFDYIPKPFTPDELRDVIANAIVLLDKKSDTKMLDLMTIVAHEFKSPVSTVHTTADTLYGGYFGNLTDEQQKVIETIKRNCQYLEDIIRCYIDLSKMELDGLAFPKQNLDFVEQVVRPAVETPEYNDNLKKMRVVVDYAAMPHVVGDANLLKIVINNLLNNAIKYGYPSTDIKIQVRQDEKHAIFSILNEGVGMSQEDIEKRLFKRFERLKQKGSEGVKGSGLGLYICKVIADKHEGKLEVTSEIGKFAQFTLYLRLA
jgi:signal transduction histidine kinase